MRSEFSQAAIDQLADALGDAPRAAYTAPLVFPWSVRNFESRPLAPRPNSGANELRLYVHVPFCRYHCTFCFYAVRAGAVRDEMERYVGALERELEWVEPGTTLRKLFVGGGTPTALPPDLLERMLGAVFGRMEAPERVHTLEASPDSIEEGHLRVLLDHGVRRVSMGVESLDVRVLETVQRRHDRDQALDACRMIVDCGLILNIDLIYGLPGQTEDSFRRDVEAAAAAGVSSLCLYALRTNENTVVTRQLKNEERFNLERLLRWREFVTRIADEAGFEQARPYYYVRRGGASHRPGRAKNRRAGGAVAQLGVGMSARSQLDNVVYRNHDRTDIYMDRIEGGESPVETLFQLDEMDRKTQFVAATLGNAEELDRASWESGFGTPIEADFGPLLQRLKRVELLEDDGARIALTEVGRLIYDRVLLCFYPERAMKWLRNQSDTTARAGWK